MPQLAPLVLQDQAATPVNHTFNPLNISGGVGALAESSGVPVGDRRFTVSLQKTSQNRYKPTVKLTLPVVQDVVVNGISRPTPVRTAYVDIQFSFDPTSSEQERKDAVAFARESLAVAKWPYAVLTKLEGVY